MKNQRNQGFNPMHHYNKKNKICTNKPSKGDKITINRKL